MYGIALALRKHYLEAGVSAVLLILLLIVAATPTYDLGHELCSCALLALAYMYTAIMIVAGVALADWPRFVAYLPLATPFFLTIAASFLGYGVWQKAMVLYFLLCAVLRHHVVVHGKASDQICQRRHSSAGVAPRKRIYRLQAERPWRRMA